MPGAFGPGVAPRRPAGPPCPVEGVTACPRRFSAAWPSNPRVPDEAPEPAGSPSPRDQEGQGLTWAPPPRFVFHKPPVCFRGVLFRVPKLYLPGRPPPGSPRELLLSSRGYFSQQEFLEEFCTRPWLLCTEQRESVCGLPPRDGTVKCVDTRPCSGALCGLSLFICEPDLPMRGGGGGWERGKHLISGMHLKQSSLLLNA